MTPHEFGLYFHHLKFRLACSDRKGAAFQTFFEDIMGLYDPTFLKVKPSGTQGDWKCDGLSQSSGTVYQCYAPANLKVRQSVAKIDADFDGALEHWKEHLKCWTFVWSAYDALPPQVVKAILNLKTRSNGVVIQDWGRETLWTIVASLTEMQRDQLLEVVPSLQDAENTTAAEVQTLLNYVVRADVPPIPEDLALTDVAKKIDRNSLGVSTRSLIQHAIPVARVVGNYVNRHPDPQFNTTVASVLVQWYRQSVADRLTPDEVFGELVEIARHGNKASLGYWAAVGIITHYFELCDIFDR
jgi:hypothetical protein